MSISRNLALPDFWGMTSPSLYTSVTNRYIGDRQGDPENSFELDTCNKLDLRMGIMSEHLEFYLWCDNLFDETYDLYGFNLGTSVIDGSTVLAGTPARGRILGIGIAYYF